MTLKNISLCQWDEGLKIIRKNPELNKQYQEFILSTIGDEELWYQNSQFFVETYHELGIINIPEEELKY